MVAFLLVFGQVGFIIFSLNGVLLENNCFDASLVKVFFFEKIFIKNGVLHTPPSQTAANNNPPGNLDCLFMHRLYQIFSGIV